MDLFAEHNIELEQFLELKYLDLQLLGIEDSRHRNIIMEIISAFRFEQSVIHQLVYYSEKNIQGNDKNSQNVNLYIIRFKLFVNYVNFKNHLIYLNLAK